MPTKADAPALEGWITLQELHERLGCTRQAVHEMAEKGKISTLHRLGSTRPVWILREAEVPDLQPTRGKAVILGRDDDPRRSSSDGQSSSAPGAGGAADGDSGAAQQGLVSHDAG